MTYVAQLFVILADTKFGQARQVRRNRASAMCPPTIGLRLAMGTSGSLIPMGLNTTAAGSERR